MQASRIRALLDEVRRGERDGEVAGSASDVGHARIMLEADVGDHPMRLLPVVPALRAANRRQ